MLRQRLLGAISDTQFVYMTLRTENIPLWVLRGGGSERIVRDAQDDCRTLVWISRDLLCRPKLSDGLKSSISELLALWISSRNKGLKGSNLVD